MTSKSISQILADAADIQEAHGKCEGILMSNEGKVCAEGAIALAEGMEIETGVGCNVIYDRVSNYRMSLMYESPATRFFARHITEVTGTLYGAPWKWNDGIVGSIPAPDCGTVVEELRRASKYADEEGV